MSYVISIANSEIKLTVDEEEKDAFFHGVVGICDKAVASEGHLLVFVFNLQQFSACK